MCERYRNMQTWSELHGALSSFIGAPTQSALNLEPREQVRPTQQAPIITTDDANAVEVWNARWWLIPWFHRGTVKDWKATTFNAPVRDRRHVTRLPRRICQTSLPRDCRRLVRMNGPA